MAIVAGIDEAGYGPLLGPLVVSGVAFQVPDALADASLWNVLKASVTRKSGARERRLPILDSKKLYSTAAGIEALERTALVMLRTADLPAPTFRGLLHVVAPQAMESVRHYAWYKDFDAALPTACSDTDVATRANAVRRDMQARGVRLIGVFSEPLPEGHYNRLITSTRNKAVVLLGLTWRIVQRILSQAGEERVHVHIDRHGGREHYAQSLMTSFGAYELRILEESAERSAYELVRSPGRHTVDFVAGGEDRHLPIALASIYSKYLRELCMSAFNAWWGERVAGLAPTAGYYTDGRRFLRDIGPAITRLGIDRDWLVRSR